MALTDDLVNEERWPRFKPSALDHGLRDLVAAPPTVHGADSGR